ncbi:hypothetical protein [Streptomyces sp. SM8]|uniref:hypothetical protein n=1 Tax=Streptomyces sp. SM8 TaxID=1195457 RepID=UPI001F251955|nr:hypothetical protein [Streptomyces sp. SM8]
MTHIITSACAEHEEQAARDAVTPRWQATGDFLADAITGMLQAPVTQRPRPHSARPACEAILNRRDGAETQPKPARPALEANQ